jgi:hypothetical protein
VIFVLVCVSLDLYWYCVVLICGFFVDSFVLYLCAYGFGVFYSIEQVLVLGHFDTLARSVTYKDVAQYAL